MEGEGTFGEVQFPKMIEKNKAKIITFNEVIIGLEGQIRELEAYNRILERHVNESKK